MISPPATAASVAARARRLSAFLAALVSLVLALRNASAQPPGRDDEPAERMRYLRRLQETAGNMPPPEAHFKAVEQVRALREALPRRFRVAGLPAGARVDPRRLAFRTAGLEFGHWEPVAAEDQAGLGGRTRALLIDPYHPDTLFAASVAGGIWRSDDGGGTWKAVDAPMANLAVTCLAGHFQRLGADLYAGTGEGYYNEDAVRGSGIFRSTDGGRTWIRLEKTKDYNHINRLAVSADGRTVLAAVLVQDQDRRIVWDRTGIYRCTDLTRQDWVLCADDVLQAHRFSTVQFHPSDEKQAIAGDFDGRVYYSPDGGGHWEVATLRGKPTGWTGRRVELAYAVKDPKYVYASIQVRSEERPTSELWCSRDGGRNYERRPARGSDGKPAYWLGQPDRTQSKGDQGWYANTVWAADDKLVVVGGLDLWRSTNGGETLQPISAWRKWGSNRNVPHADQHVIVGHPNFGDKNKTIYVGNDGGIYMTTDVHAVAEKGPADGWVGRNTGYHTLQFYAAAGLPTRIGERIILAGAQDNGTHLLTIRTSAQGSGDPDHKGAPLYLWDWVLGGDGGYCAIDPSGKYLYCESQFLQISRITRTEDGNLTHWDDLSGQFSEGGQWKWKKSPLVIEDAREGQVLFIAPFLLDPNNATRLLAGGWQLWRTTIDDKTVFAPDKGPEWAAIKPGLGRADDWAAYISTISMTPGRPEVIWVGHVNGQVFRTTNGTAKKPSWGDPLLTVPGRRCTRIVPDPADPDRVVYATFAGYREASIWKTIDGGKEWKPIRIEVSPEYWRHRGGEPESPFPEKDSKREPLVAPVYALTIHPLRSNWVYIGTEVGVFASDDGGKHWGPTNEGPTNCRVDDLVWIGNTLVAATHARGLYSINLTPRDPARP
jgi:photosystem II stability/assembly factor-like uncharacterized protein